MTARFGREEMGRSGDGGERDGDDAKGEGERDEELGVDMFVSVGKG